MTGDATAEFLESLAGDAPPGGLLGTVWHGLRGEWQSAHDIAEADHSSEGAWVHAWLHRIEGDLGNAAYWYRRAGRPVCREALRDEGEAIARALLRAS